MQKKEDIKKLFIDTSVFIRFFTKDDQKKYDDCLIVTQIPKGTRLITYDGEFSKIKSLRPLTPAEVLSAA